MEVAMERMEVIGRGMACRVVGDVVVGFFGFL